MPVSRRAILTRDDAKWKTHVKDDLNAYVCLFEECDIPDQLYSHSEDWLKHMREHASRWRCKSKSHGPLLFDTRDEYTEHMKEAHKGVFSDAELHILADRNARIIRPLFETCPLCGLDNTARGGNIEEHIVGHLRFLALKSLPTYQDDEASQSSDAESASSRVSKPRKRSTIENDPERHTNVSFDDNGENRSVEQSGEIDLSNLSPYEQYGEPRKYVSAAGSLPALGDSQPIEESRAFVEMTLFDQIPSTEWRQFEWGFVIEDLEASMNIENDPVLRDLALKQLPPYAPKVNPTQRGVDPDSASQHHPPVDHATKNEGIAFSASKTDQSPIPVSNSLSANPFEADNDTNPAILGDGQSSDVPQDAEDIDERIHGETRSDFESGKRRPGASSSISPPTEGSARPPSPPLSSSLKQSHRDVHVMQQRGEVDHISDVPVTGSVSLETPPQTHTCNSILVKSDIPDEPGKKNGPRFKNIDALENIDLDDMISHLLNFTGFSPREPCLSHEEIIRICTASREIFLSQPMLLELTAPLKIVGDIHGQYTDLIRIFQMSGFPPTVNYLFLGDYVDRGKRSLETILLLLCYKLKYPENFFLLRGNHESANITRVYGFYDECKRRCNIKIWKTFIDVFNCLPVASVVAGKIFCVHGGLSPSLLDIKEIRQLERPTDVPDYGLLTDLLWSDPIDMEAGWEPNERGVSYCFGKGEIKSFLSFNDFDLICRAHMVVEDGYEFYDERLLVTLFSAPNYCGEFDNWGGIMSVSDSLLCSFELLKPADFEASSAAKLEET